MSEEPKVRFLIVDDHQSIQTLHDRGRIARLRLSRSRKR